MKFAEMANALNQNFTRRFDNSGSIIFEAGIDKDELWNLYLDSFPAGTNEIYRTRRWHDCSCCRHFIRTVGGSVAIDEDLNMHTIFEFDTNSDIYQPVMDILDRYVKSKMITDVYFHSERRVGDPITRELLDDGTVKTWEHFFVNLPVRCVKPGANIPTLKGKYRDAKNVFKRSLDEISIEALDTVLELIVSNTLYKGEEWRNILITFRDCKRKYDALPDDKKDLYAWSRSVEGHESMTKLRNHSIGVLLVDISNGDDLDDAVRRYEKIVAPTNYKRPKAIYTQRMLDDAKKTVTELGYMDSLPRRFATLDDITANNILFINRDSAKRISGDVFDDMAPPTTIKNYSKVEEISADKFISDILPTAKEVEVYVENRHSQNMVSLIAPVNNEAPSMFKWTNSFGWAYAGNITDSDIRENVKNAGGNVDGALRFSIQWNDTGVYSGNDLDAHCIADINYARMNLREYSKSSHIYFGSPRDCLTHGCLDVDIQNPKHGVPAVENIVWQNKNLMLPGKYIFTVHQYANRGGKDGFRAEIEFDGQIYKFDYNKKLRQDEIVDVATVTLDANGKFSIKEHLKSEMSSREVWGVKTNTFVPASVIMYSPNYWDDQVGIGHRHYFFMLKDCANPEKPNGFYNEFLKNDLEKHKRVFEALGSKMAVANAEDQLSGIGFSASKRNDVIVRVTGATLKRMMKIKF